MTPTHQVSPAQRRGAVLLAFGLFAGFELVAQRGGVRLAFDSYYYVEYAKQFRQHPPGAFGSAWPFGWPLLGSATGAFGLSAYQGLLAWAWLCVLGLVALAAKVLPWEKLGLAAGALLLGSIAGTFILTISVSEVFSEVPFALSLLAFALCLARWPERGAILTSAGLALLSLALRYAGALTLVMLGGWCVLNFRPLRNVGRLRFALLSVGVAGLVAVALLSWNYATTGRFSGHERGDPVPVAEWLGIASDFGWSLPAALGGLGLRDALGFGTFLRLPVGLAILGSLLTLTGCAWRRGMTPESRAIGAVFFSYSLGLVALRCHASFDALHSPRMFVPLLFPLLVLAAQLFPSRRLLVLGGAGLLALNAVLCLRGASLQIGADTRAALPVIAGATPRDTIAVNDQALTLSALTNARVVRSGDPSWPQPAGGRGSCRFIVLSAPPLDRQGHSSGLASGWEAFASALIEKGDYAVRLRTPTLLVLERTDRIH